MKLNCLIVDDEPVARKGIAEYVRELDYLNLMAECENAMKAAALINDHRIDLIFLDIQMPKLSGIEFIKTLKTPPLVILTTAYSEFAVEGYSLDVVDYLLKPVTFDRFVKASQKALELSTVRSGSPQTKNSDYFFVRCESKFEKVHYAEVLFVEAMQNYVIIHLAGRKLITYLTIGGLESQLPGESFMKVHKSFIVNTSQITAVDGNDIFIGGTTIPISRSMKDLVLGKVMGNKLFKR